MSSALITRKAAHHVPGALTAARQYTSVEFRAQKSIPTAALRHFPKGKFNVQGGKAAQTYPLVASTSCSRRFGSKKSHDKGNSPLSSEQPNPNIGASSKPPTEPPPAQSGSVPYHHPRPPLPPRSPITNWVLASPRRTEFLLKLGDWLGYGSPKQLAANRSKVMYNICSEVATGPEHTFWYNTLSLPQTFQSWLTITNLHVWLVTVRLRALPPPHGRAFIQALIDHFFLDVEDRLRAVLSKKAPERLITRQMKIAREQWGGLGLAFDHALVTGDKAMASAIWRNLLGARGAQGISYIEPETIGEGMGDSVSTPSPQKPEDPSLGGVSDFEGSAVDKYLVYPQLMLTLVGYLRRELVRLEQISDADILGGVGRGMRASMLGAEHGTLVVKDLRDVVKFGKVRDAARRMGVEAHVF